MFGAGGQASEDLGIHTEGKAERILGASNGSGRRKAERLLSHAHESQVGSKVFRLLEGSRSGKGDPKQSLVPSPQGGISVTRG